MDATGKLGVDKDFVIRGLLLITDAPISFDVAAIERHWPAMETQFDNFSAALRSAVDFCREPWVGLTSASLIEPLATLYPIIHFLSHQTNGNVPEDQRKSLRTIIYLLIFNRFLRGKSPQSRLGWVREKMNMASRSVFPVNEILTLMKTKQIWSIIETSSQMLNWNPRLALNIVQTGVCRETLSWQVKAEVDHIFPQSLYREKYGDLVDDIGNLAYLGKLRNIRKSNQQPWEYFENFSDEELLEDFLIKREFMREDDFPVFVENRREAIVGKVKEFLGV